MLIRGTLAMLATASVATAIPVITSPTPGAVIQDSSLSVEVSTSGIPYVQSLKILANGVFIGHASPMGFFGEWSFPDGAHLSVMDGQPHSEAMIDYKPAGSDSSMYFFNGDFINPSRFEDPDSQVAIDFSFSSGGLLSATLNGPAPLGTHNLAGGKDFMSEAWHFVWSNPSAGTQVLTAEVSYLPTGTGTPVVAVSTGVSVTIQPPLPDIAVEQPAKVDLVAGKAVRNFGRAAVRSTGERKTFIIRNHGVADLNGLAIRKTGLHADDFLVTRPLKPVLAPGASTLFSVTFKPTASGIRRASIRIASNDADENPFTIDLSGVGSVAPEIVVEQPARSSLIDGKAKRTFGTVKVGRAAIPRVFTIRNTGTASLSGIAVRKTGAHAADFIVSKPLSASLAPGSFTTFRVTFRPRAKGLRNATLQITSNDADENPFDIALGGFGAAR